MTLLEKINRIHIYIYFKKKKEIKIYKTKQNS